MKIKGDGDQKIRTDSIPIYGDTLKKLAVIQKAHPKVKGKSLLWKAALDDATALPGVPQEMAELRKEIASLKAEIQDLTFVLKHHMTKQDNNP